MNTILYLSLGANGCFAKADATHPIPKEIIGNFAESVGKFGNLIIGRNTYDLMKDQLSQTAFPGIELIVVSKSLSKFEGGRVAASPLEALHYLEQKGFSTALVGGGAQLDSCLLGQGLIDEIYLNIEPLLIKSGTFVTNENHERNLKLVNTSKLGDNILQLQYKVESGRATEK
jgi:dihydrofolate reductase